MNTLLILFLCCLLLCCLNLSLPTLMLSMKYEHSSEEALLFNLLFHLPDSINATIPIFYNLFVKDQSDLERVRHDIVEDQLGYIDPTVHGPVYVTSIGVRIDVEGTVGVQYFDNANEEESLHLLWMYCRQNPTQRVVYLHSKGSFHPSEDNDKLRSFATQAALSKQCDDATKSEDSCDVCSGRFSPLPHAHTSGNMWLAKCNYISNLLDPATFSEAMDSVYPCHESLLHNKTTLDKLEMRNGVHMSCRGLGRFAAEHWIHSHPFVRICDLYKNQSFVWGYDGLPDRPNRTRAQKRRTQNRINHTIVKNVAEYDFQVSPAPRFPDLRTYKLRPLQGVCPQTLEDRFREYQVLYGKSPNLSNLTDLSMNWWGWNVSNFRRILLDHEPLNTTISTLGRTALKEELQNLYELWYEYARGLSGNKPARLFTKKERTRLWHKRNLAWMIMDQRINAGYSLQDTCDKIYEEYGRGKSVDEIVDLMSSDLEYAIKELRLMIQKKTASSTPTAGTDEARQVQKLEKELKKVLLLKQQMEQPLHPDPIHELEEHKPHATKYQTPPVPPRVDDPCNNASNNTHDFRTRSQLYAIVTGCENSGTSILSELIMSAPNVYGPFESGMLLPSHPKRFSHPDFRPFNDWLHGPIKLARWGLTLDQYHEALKSECFEEMYQKVRHMSPLFQLPQNVDSWTIDKTPRYIYNLPEIMKKAPDVPVIVSVKNDKKQIESWMKHWDQGHIDEAPGKLRSAREALQTAKELFGDRIYVVHYEELIQYPDKVMSDVYKFLKLGPWNSSYLSMKTFNSKAEGSSRFKVDPFQRASRSKNETDIQQQQ